MTTPHGAPELKVCPFCGVEPELIHTSVHCNNAYCEAQPFTAGQSLAEAAAAWNRRAIQQAAGAVPEGMQLVPIEPTPAMLEASLRAFEWGWTEPCPELLECGVPVESGITHEEADQINADAMKEHAMMYRAFLAASPSPLGREAGKEGSSDHLVPCAVGGVTQWQPIETRPKDDGSYLVADATRGFVAPHIRGVIHNNPGTEWDWQYGEACTHWMPLPPPPARGNDAPTSQINHGSAPREDEHG